MEKNFDKITVSESGESLNFPKNTEAYTFSFDNYMDYDVDGEVFIVGYNENKKPFSNEQYRVQLKKFNDSMVLDSLLSLANELRGASCDYKRTMRYIFKWCNTYGFPFFWRNGWVNPAFPEMTDKEYYQRIGYYGFSYSKFVTALSMLENSIKVASEFKRASSFKNLSKDEEQILLDYERITNMSLAINPSFRLSYEDSTVNMVTLLPNVNELSKYQVMLYILSDKGHGIAVCKCCGAYFFLDRANKKYCRSCNPKKQWKRKVSAEKKEDSNKKEATDNGEQN